MEEPKSIYAEFPDLEARWSAFADWNAASIQFYESQLVGKGVKSVLEPGCGFGRVLEPLARAGIQVFGYDAIPERIELAKRRFADQQLQNAEFVVGEMPDVPTDRMFDAAIIAVNTIGYIPDVDDKRKLLRNIRERLNPIGRLLFDFQRGEIGLRWIKAWSSLTGKIGSDHLRSRVRWDENDDCVVEEFTLMRKSTTEHFEDRLRLGTVSELEQLLNTAGFKVARRWGSFGGKPFRPWSSMAILEARPVASC